METGATPSDRRRPARKLPRFGPEGEGWVGIQTLIALAVLVLAIRTSSPEASPSLQVVRALGLLGVLVGIAGFIWGARTLGPSFDIWLRPTARAKLVTTGPYGHIRHPICTSQALIGVGWAALWLSAPALAGAMVYATYLYVFKLRAEEELLDERYPAYAEYRRRVPHRMIPRPWEPRPR